MKKPFCFFSILFFLHTFSFCQNPEQEKEIYMTIFKYFQDSTKGKKEAKIYVITDSTYGKDFGTFMNNILVAMPLGMPSKVTKNDSATVFNLLHGLNVINAMNSKSLVNIFSGEHNVFHLSRKQFNDTVKKGHYQNFIKYFPGSCGLFTFSRISFSADQKYAALTVGWWDGGFNMGNYYILKKEGEKWKIIYSGGIWIT